MNEATGSRRDAASVLFDLAGYRVLDAVDTDDGRRQVKIASTRLEAGCLSCGVLSARVHQRVEQRLVDVPVAGRLEVVLVKRRFACVEPLCHTRTFVQASEQVPPRARVRTRLRQFVLQAVTGPVVRSVRSRPRTACPGGRCSGASPRRPSWRRCGSSATRPRRRGGATSRG